MKKISALFLVLVLGACSFNSKEKELAEIEQRNFLISGFNLSEKPKGEMNIYDAIARASVNSIDARTQTLSDIIGQELMKDDYKDVLPKIVEIAGYKPRYNPDFYFATLGSDLETKVVTADPNHRNSLAAVWDMIDFSLTYTRARLYANPIFLKEALKRKAMQNISSDVKFAFYRVAAAQQIEPEVQKLTEALQKALEDLDKNPEREKLLSYRNALQNNLNQVLSLKKESVMARLELSSLLGLGQYTDFKIQPPVDLTTEKLEKYSLHDLEFQALERHHNIGMIDMDAKEEIVYIREQVDAILPDVELGYNDIKGYDYFQNQAWEEAGLKISWNLISLLNSMKNSITKEDRKSLLKVYSLATGTAILSEVNISYLRFYQALNNFKIVLLLSEIKEDIANKSSINKINNLTDLDNVSKRIEALLAKTKIYYAYSELKDAEDILLISVGVKNYPTSLTPVNIQRMAEGKPLVDAEEEIKLDLDGNIESENWAQGDKWLEVTVTESLYDKTTNPISIAPKSKPQSGSDLLIDVKNYTKPVSKKPAKAKIRKATVSAKSSSLQLGSFKSESKATQAWNELKSRYNSLANLSYDVVSANVSGVGRVYRLMVNSNKTTLKNLCSVMKTDLGNSCIIKN